MFKPRVPVGKLILELPAGMIDDEAGDVVGTALREVILIFLSFHQLEKGTFFLLDIDLIHRRCSLVRLKG